MMVPPYLKADVLYPLMRVRPVSPFFVRPRDYRVIDGDTLMILAPKGNSPKREEAFRVRMFSINAPEKQIKTITHSIMVALGHDPHSGSPGKLATSFLRSAVEGRVLLIEPKSDGDRSVDSYGRLLARISISGRRSHFFAPEDAVSAEYHLYRHGHAVLLKGKAPPEPITPLLADLYTKAEVLNSFS